MIKQKKKFNFIDIAIIVFVIAVAAVLIKVYVSDDSSSDVKNSVTLQYVIQSDMLSEELADNVSPGDVVYEKKTGRAIGKVSSCDVRGALHTGVSDAGAQVISDIAGYRVLYITVEVDAAGAAGGYSVENIPICAGEDYELMFKNLYCTGTCISVEVIG